MPPNDQLPFRRSARRCVSSHAEVTWRLRLFDWSLLRTQSHSLSSLPWIPRVLVSYESERVAACAPSSPRRGAAPRRSRVRAVSPAQWAAPAFPRGRGRRAWFLLWHNNSMNHHSFADRQKQSRNTSDLVPLKPQGRWMWIAPTWPLWRRVKNRNSRPAALWNLLWWKLGLKKEIVSVVTSITKKRRAAAAATGAYAGSVASSSCLSLSLSPIRSGQGKWQERVVAAVVEASYSLLVYPGEYCRIRRSHTWPKSNSKSLFKDH
jgi:hypothetical protein